MRARTTGQLALACFFGVFGWCALVRAGDDMTRPGVYSLDSGELLGVGQGKLRSSLRGATAVRAARDAAQRDAKQRIARHLYPELFNQGKPLAIDIRHARVVSESAPNGKPSMVHAALAVRPENVHVALLPDASVITGATKVVVDREMLRYLDDPLLQLGGGRIFARGDGWIAVGVGASPLLGNDSTAEREAMKRARLEAGKALVETVFGVDTQVLEHSAETQLERDGVQVFKEWSRKQTRETVEGRLANALEAGYWLSDDDHVVVVVAVSDAPLETLAWNQAGQDEETLIPEYPDWEVEPEWEYVLLSRPRLLRGGAIVAPGVEAGGAWALGVGAAKLTGNPANDQMNAPRLAGMDAQRHIVRYLLGFSSASATRDVEEVTLLWDENGLESSAVVESLRKMTKETASGYVRGLRCVGSWKSEDGKLLYQVHVVPMKTPRQQ